MTAPTVAPLSWQLLLWLRDRLQRISTENGYYTDVGGRVHLEAVAVTDRTALPAVWLYEDDTEVAERELTAEARQTCQFVVECVAVGDDLDAQLVAHRVRHDLRRALPRIAKNCLPGVMAIGVTGAQILPHHDERGMPFTSCRVTLRASLSETFPPA